MPKNNQKSSTVKKVTNDIYDMRVAYAIYDSIVADTICDLHFTDVICNSSNKDVRGQYILPSIPCKKKFTQSQITNSPPLKHNSHKQHVIYSITNNKCTLTIKIK